MAFESISDIKIEELLKIPKKVLNPNSRAKNKDGHEQFNYKLQSTTEEDYYFELYTRQNTRKDMEDDFSCGLSWIAPNGEPLTLCRNNGPNHNHPNKLENERLGYVCHKHQTTEKYINANRKPEGYAVPTQSYRTLKGAVYVMFNECNITGISSEPDLAQLFEL